MEAEAIVISDSEDNDDYIPTQLPFRRRQDSGLQMRRIVDDSSFGNNYTKNTNQQQQVQHGFLSFDEVDQAEQIFEDHECPICLASKCESPAMLDKCFHVFCMPCILQWIFINPSCPLCKRPFESVLHDITRAEGSPTIEFKRFFLRDLEHEAEENRRRMMTRASTQSRTNERKRPRPTDVRPVEANEYDSPHVLSKRRAVYARGLRAQPVADISRHLDAKRMMTKRQKRTATSDPILIEQDSNWREKELGSVGGGAKKVKEVIDLCEDDDVQIIDQPLVGEKEKEKEKKKEKEKEDYVSFDLSAGLLRVANPQSWQRKGKMWVTRELKALLGIDDVHLIVLVVGKALESFQIHRSIRTLEDSLRDFVPAEHQETFLHELYCFLSSPLQTLRDYDKAVRYVHPL